MEKVCFRLWLGEEKIIMIRGNIYIECSMCRCHLNYLTHINLFNPYNHLMEQELLSSLIHR